MTDWLCGYVRTCGRIKCGKLKLLGKTLQISAVTRSPNRGRRRLELLSWGSMKTVELKTWEEFESEVSRLERERSDRISEKKVHVSEYLYRGQPDSNGSL